MLKADLHIHTSMDPKDGIKVGKVSYSPYDIIDLAKKKRINLLSFTHHDEYFVDAKVSAYAKKKGIMLLPGIEKCIEGSHVLIYNAPKKLVEEIETLDELRELKKKRNILVIAPHPFHLLLPGLGRRLINNIDLFDAIELSYFTSKVVDFNGRAKQIAKKFAKPLVATSDSHFLFQFGDNYSMIDADNRVMSVIDAIKKGNLRVHERRLSIFGLVKVFLAFVLSELKLSFVLRFFNVK